MYDPTTSKLKVYNTLTRSVDDFVPEKPPRVTMFVCGPTVYDVSHIGHAKTYVAYDIMARYLRRKRFSVFFIINITDIDDRIINRARETGKDALEISRKFAEDFYKDMRDLRVNSVNLYPKASDHIREIIGQIEGLLKLGKAYRLDGDVYYDISKFADYGKLSRQKLEQLTVHRVDPDTRKKHPGDFVLWKSQKPGEIAWDSPWGKGRPGWHIEDTAITLTYFGPTYDLHGGGTELIFPHHEAEIAQAEGLTGVKPLAKYWVHTGLLSVKGKEMHKSLGNFIPIQDMIAEMGVDALRVFYASTHYRSPLDFTQEALTQAASLSRRFQRIYDQLLTIVAASTSTGGETILPKVAAEIGEARDEFFNAMDDDFNTPRALTALIKIVSTVEEQSGKLDLETASFVLEILKDQGSVLGIFGEESAVRDRINEIVRLLLDLRSELRTKRDFATADRIRELLTKTGLLVEDVA
ncbi:MAG TPA: cysteine--tRNA ligase [Candidatus Bathyarchaeia archaeon]|nr:cysteine--tRNA ligase [Candidatus Bathyarchaeia archaeon]